MISRRKFCFDAMAAGTVLPLDACASQDGDGREVLSGAARKKRSLGQFFTAGACWLQPQIVDFLVASKCEIAYDPFAGSGCLFNPVTNAVKSIREIKGLDIDESQGWPVNDSLQNIPHVENAVIVTNPPYISSYSAARKRIDENLKRYFNKTKYDDVYLLALDKMLDAQKNVVAIVPETFINSPYRRKELLSSITILEQNPFLDTDTPVVVVCFDSVPKSFDNVRVYKDASFVCSLNDAEKCRLIPDNSVQMRFNDPAGWLGVRCVDTTNPADMIRFDFKENIDYDWDKGIKVSSRLLTLVSVDVPSSRRKDFLKSCNRILKEMRMQSHDIILSPFKGNMKNGKRRRRLDFQTCRAIIERGYKMSVSCVFEDITSQPDLFKEAI